MTEKILDFPIQKEESHSDRIRIAAEQYVQIHSMLDQAYFELMRTISEYKDITNPIPIGRILNR